MNRDEIVNNRILTLAGHMADAAGDLARRYWRTPVSSERKTDLSPVTQADREIETALRKLVEEYFPEHGIIGEEHGNVRPESPWQWVLDPIDGTRAFIAGYPTFTTLLALAYEGAPVLGMIDQPIMRERWIGIKDQPTLLNGKPVHTIGCSRLSDAVVGTTSVPYHFSKTQASCFEQLRKQCANTIVGGDGYGYAMLASGRLGLFVDAGLKPYDFCPLACVIEGAGGIITDWRGKALTLSSDGTVVAAATKELHAQALIFLQSAI